MRNIVIVRNPDLSVESDCTVVDRSFNLEVVQMEAAACECSCVSHSHSHIHLNHSFKSKSPSYLRRIKHSYKAQYIYFLGFYIVARILGVRCVKACRVI